jgi:hypothetical protein
MKWTKDHRDRLTALVTKAHKAKRRVDWYNVADRMGCTAGAAQAQWRMLQWSPLKLQQQAAYDRDRRRSRRKLEVADPADAAAATPRSNGPGA